MTPSDSLALCLVQSHDAGRVVARMLQTAALAQNASPKRPFGSPMGGEWSV